jgi:hypothetical protein
LAGLTSRRTIKGVSLPAISRYFDGEEYIKYKLPFFLTNGFPLSGYTLILSMTHAVLTNYCRPGEQVNYYHFLTTADIIHTTSTLSYLYYLYNNSRFPTVLENFLMQHFF